jgi:hypothetical protein
VEREVLEVEHEIFEGELPEETVDTKEGKA